MLLVDLPINDEVHLQHELLELPKDYDFSHFVFNPFLHCIVGEKEGSRAKSMILGCA